MFNNKELKRLRVVSCLSQDELAKAIGTNQQTISAWERDQKPSGKSVKKLARFFKLEPEQLFI